MADRDSATGARAGAWILIALLALSVAGFAVTRAMRASDDIVNTVSLSAELEPDGAAEIRFTTTVEEREADVLVIGDDEEPVRALQAGEPLAKGAHRFTWDGRDDEGLLLPPGAYGLRVILHEEGRDIVPPGEMELLAPQAESGGVGAG